MSQPIPLQNPFAPRPVDQLCPVKARHDDAAAPMCPCESVWTCMRGPTRLCCELHRDTDGRCQLTLRRNSRSYGHYEFDGRDSALTFAARLRDTFQGNGWSGC